MAAQQIGQNLGGEYVIKMVRQNGESKDAMEMQSKGHQSDRRREVTTYACGSNNDSRGLDEDARNVAEAEADADPFMTGSGEADVAGAAGKTRNRVTNTFALTKSRQQSPTRVFAPSHGSRSRYFSPGLESPSPPAQEREYRTRKTCAGGREMGREGALIGSRYEDGGPAERDDEKCGRKLTRGERAGRDGRGRAVGLGKPLFTRVGREIDNRLEVPRFRLTFTCKAEGMEDFGKRDHPRRPIWQGARSG
ncbi:LOW QUALITY PROTEIN: hypothetical protein CVT26_000742 [Gymnopilus dilepis]|uniref:Uncharacterized protein n=1 Tax=Gymnopilus dilepis TaxID=231916 RepID=A0A409Y2L7_9AGAR|nr:LOW QUALITY PROTEIN: hypothetical protein CVT26_000742 [Gymnopilus dilepis]